jgi:hypothetical protein
MFQEETIFVDGLAIDGDEEATDLRTQTRSRAAAPPRTRNPRGQLIQFAPSCEEPPKRRRTCRTTPRKWATFHGRLKNTHTTCKYIFKDWN